MTRSRRPNKPLKGLHGAAKVGALWRRVEDFEWAQESARKLAASKAGDVRQEMLEGAAKLEPWDLWALENDYEDDYDPGCECGGCLFIRKYLDDRRSDSPKASDE